MLRGRAFSSLPFQYYLVPILSFSTRMESRHLDFNTDDLREEQQTIDKLIDSLLTFNPSSPANNAQRKKSGNNSSIYSPAPANRGRGRPPKVTRITPASPTPVDCEQKPSFETVIECLNKLNAQNKRLLDFVEVLSVSVKSSSENITQEVPAENASTPIQQNVIDGVNDRLEKIEQNLNETTLVCSGPAVADLLKPSSTGDSPNLERLKGEVCKTVCGEDITSIDVGNLQLSLYGRNKKCIRLQCSSFSSKLHLLRRARERRPQGFYVSEFLTAAKLKIFHNLRQLRKQHPEKIKSIFTRRGNVLYTLQDSSQVFHAASLEDLTNIFGSGSSETPSTT